MEARKDEERMREKKAEQDLSSSAGEALARQEPVEKEIEATMAAAVEAARKDDEKDQVSEPVDEEEKKNNV